MEYGKPKPLTGWRLWLYVMGVIAAMGAMLYWLASPPSPPTPRTQEQLLADAKALALDQARDKSVAFAKAVKGALRDPDSVVWESIRANPTADVICIEYRAKNGFGGFNRETVVQGNGKISQHKKDWKKFCEAELTDMASIIKEI